MEKFDLIYLFGHDCKASIGHSVFDESPSRIASRIAATNNHKPANTHIPENPKLKIQILMQKPNLKLKRLNF